MVGFWLLLGHLLGDYILQNDWQATNKTNPHPGSRPGAYRPRGFADARTGRQAFEFVADPDRVGGWRARRRAWRVGHVACTAHCLLYTLAVWACSFGWMPAWGLVACFAAHWPMDRFRLAKVWMTRASGQTAFAAGGLAPWSVIVVDNTIHLLTLGLIAAAAGVR